MFAKKPTRIALAIAAVLGLSISGCNDDDTNNNNNNEDPAVSMTFNRAASFLVCSQLDANCDVDTETVSEIVAASEDGMTLIYSDSPNQGIGFVDITDPSSPKGLGSLAMSGEPTSVAVLGDYAVVGVNTSADYINTSGHLSVVDIATQKEITTIDLGGQPDSVSVSKDGAYIAIAIENERDEDLGDGAPPQMPAGYLSVISVEDATDPSTWTVSKVEMTGLQGMLYADDPEPEYVDINEDNIAVVTLQENNHVVLVDLAAGEITNHFSLGSVDLTQVDATEEDPAIISQTESLDAVLREPDGVTWIDTEHFATANEGDLDGGSRGFSIFSTDGDVVFDSGNTLDHIVASLGHYPDGRSGNKGNEPENVDYAVFNGTPYLFIASERANVVFVYDMTDPMAPLYQQTLPAAVGPEGILAIPERNLVIAASEVDSRDDKIRSALNIYSASPSDETEATYPTIMSTDRDDGTPIPFSALSGLASKDDDATILYSLDDSFYASNRIFKIDASAFPAQITEEIQIRDDNDVLKDELAKAALVVNPAAAEDDPTRINVFDTVDAAAMINADKTVNIDGEGIDYISDMSFAGYNGAGFMLASEGSGTVGDAGRPINSPNLLVATDENGVIVAAQVFGTAELGNQERYGFEGVAMDEDTGTVLVGVQRPWNGEAGSRLVAIDTKNDQERTLYYTFDAPESPAGGWVGISDLESIGNDQFLVLERDNQGGPDARIKRIYKIDVSGLADGATVTKTLVKDLIADGDLPAGNGLISEKVEGLTMDADGNLWVNNDNDGVDDNSGENQLINLGPMQ